MGIGQVLTMPLIFASNAIDPIPIMPAWLKVISRFNPLTYKVGALCALSLKVAAGSLPRQVIMPLFVGPNILLGPEMIRAFVVGIHSACIVSAMLWVVAAGFSLLCSKEDRRRQAHAPEE